ncbi:MAG: AraC family transcriptional regulator [Spirochaetia bacterium]|nr:AraC family transcriptional regulator [Spirochaetia bacterium]
MDEHNNNELELESKLPEHLNLVQIEHAYELEQELLHAVKWGNPYKVEEVLLKRRSATNLPCCDGNTVASKALRCCKNHLISLNALCCNAARSGGLQSLYLYTMKNKYNLMIEHAVSVSHLDEVLYAQIALDYAKAVLEFSVSSYSPMIKQIVTYLTVHLSEDVRIEDLGRMHNTHISHISRKFKKETGMSIPAYVSIQRMSLAKLYFEDGEVSIKDVSQRLGFSDSNYFSKVFKRYCNQTPSEYIKMIHER